MKFVHWLLINNKPALIPVMAWHQTGDKPLPKPMLAKLSDTVTSLGRNKLTHW